MIASKRIEEKKEAKSYILLITPPITDDFHSQHPHATSIISSWRGPHIGYKPKSVISVMMITTLVFEQMSLRFEGAMGFHCNRKTERQMTKRTISLSQMSRAKLA